MLAAIDGVPMIRRTVESLVNGGVARVIVVAPAQHVTTFARALAGLPVTCIVNPDPDRGMFSSIQCGVLAADGTCVLLPGDMPFIAPATIAGLLVTAGTTGQTVVPRLQGHPGHPVVCSAALKAKILASAPPARLDHLMRDEDVLFWDVTDAGVRRDVDTPSDLPRSI